MGATPIEADARAALERFVVDNDDLLEMESVIGRFNIFDALGVARAEIRHSNFLAFILDPAESHGQSQLFLRALVMDLLKIAPPTGGHLSPIEVDGSDLRGVEVRREWNNIDLLITSRQPAFVVVVENKVDSGEHSDQLSRYRATVERHFPGVRPLYVYLTPDGAEPSEAGWVAYGYGDLHRVLSRVRRTYANAIGDDVRIFLDHYLSLIGTRFMDSPEIDDLCRRIYKNHRQALQLIYDRVGSPASGVIAEVEAILADDPRWHVFRRRTRQIDVVPRDWLTWLPEWGLDDKDQPKGWLLVRFEAGKTRLAYYAKVGRIDDKAKRRQVVEALLAHGADVGLGRKQNKAVKIKDSSTRISTRTPITEWSEDDEPDPAAIRAAVVKLLNDLHPKLLLTRSVVQPLL